MLRSTKYLAILAIALMALVPLAVMIDDSSDADGVDYSRYYYRQLGENEKAVYNKIVTLDGTNQFTVKGNVLYQGYSKFNDIIEDGHLINSATLSRALAAVKMDCPGLYWTSLGSHINAKDNPESSLDEVDVTITLDRIMSGTTYVPYNSVGDKTINAKIADAVNSNKIVKTDNDVATMRSIHDFIIDTMTYATTELDAEKASETPNYTMRSMYKAIAGDGRVVCEGYAKSFKYLCDKYKIPCIIVVGTANSGGSAENHMWNLAMAGGNWYVVDCTWDDPVGGSERSDYFLVGSDKTGTSHYPTTTTNENKFSIPSLSPTAYTGYPKVTVTYSKEEAAPTEYTIGDKVTLTNPKGERGYTLAGWCTDEELTNEFTDGSRVYKNITLYANWVEANKRTITFSADNATGVPANMQVYENQEDKLPTQTPSKSHYRFSCWNDKADGTGKEYQSGGEITTSKNITLYAQWIEVYEISFNSNEGMNAPETITIDVGKSAILPELTPTKIGWNFANWNDAVDGTGKIYNPGDRIVPESDVTLFAQYEEIEISPFDINNILSGGIINDFMTGLDDFGKQTEEYLGEPWVGGIANVYVIIAAAIAFLIIGVAATRKP